MSLRRTALAALSTALLAGPGMAFAQSEPATPPASTEPAMPAEPGAPPPTLPGEPAAAPATAMPTAADVDAQLTKNFGESATFKTFLSDLQKAVADEDKKAVAAMVAYPFKTKVKGEETTLAKEADFVKAYDDVMTPNIVNAIRDQKYEALTVTAQGVGIGTGQVWFAKSGTGADAKIKLIAVNQNAGA